MSRFTLICSFVVGLSSSALANTAEAQFAKAPPAPTATAISGPRVAMADVPVASDARVAKTIIVNRSSVRAALAKSRASNLALFKAYQQKGVFPSNTYRRGKLNVWIDEDGNFCAAATIIKTSGHANLAIKIGEDNNFIRLADVKQGPLMDWILTSGFTQDELAMIQEPFVRVSREPEPLLVDAKLRKAEDARLIAKYRSVERQLRKQQARSLDRAVDRLMKNKSLAHKLVASQA